MKKLEFARIRIRNWTRIRIPEEDPRIRIRIWICIKMKRIRNIAEKRMKTISKVWSPEKRIKTISKVWSPEKRIKTISKVWSPEKRMKTISKVWSPEKRMKTISKAWSPVKKINWLDIILFRKQSFAKPVLSQYSVYTSMKEDTEHFCEQFYYFSETWSKILETGNRSKVVITPLYLDL